MIKEETGYFSSFDGTGIFYRAWNKKSKHCLIIVHGIGEHSGRYYDLIHELIELPLSVYTFDLRGHGRSEGRRVYVDRFDDFIKDLIELRSFILKRNPGCSFSLLGQSLGGLISTSAVLYQQDLWKSLILLSPFLAVYLGHPFLSTIAAILNRYSPDYVVHNPIEPFSLTHVLEEIVKYKQDPDIQRRITGRLAHEMFLGCKRVQSRMGELVIPIFILAAGKDRIVSSKAAQNFYNRVSSADKRIEIFPNCYHEILHENEKWEAIQMIKTYLNNLGL